MIVIVWVRHRRELARFKAEQAEAQRNAEKEVQQIQHSRTTVNLQPLATELPCPSCGKLIRSTETTCPLLWNTDCGFCLRSAFACSASLSSSSISGKLYAIVRIFKSLD